ncbi:MAG: TRAP transporter substrate-binding protein [Pseudomonadota bacterium]
MRTKKFIWTALAILLISMTMPAQYAVAQEEKNIMLKCQSMFPLALPVLGKPLGEFAEMMEIATNGKIRFKMYDPGKLVPPKEILEAVSNGQLQAGYAAPGFWQGKIASAPLFSSVPFGPEGPEYLAWMFHGNGMKLYQEAYDAAGFNVKVFPLIMAPPETSGWFVKEIKTPADFKGVRMRFYGLGGSVIEKLGASANMLPPAEIFPALEKGVIDAAEFSSPSVDESQAFYKVVKYNYYPGWHQQATFLELIINKDIWNKMTKDQQAIINMGVRANLLQTMADGEGTQGAVIKRNAEKRGVHNMYWSDEMLNAFQSAWNEVVKEQCDKDAMFKKAWDDLSAFRKEYKSYSKLGFLPR